MYIGRSTLRDLVEAVDGIISEEKLFLCTYKGMKVEVYADTPAWAKVRAANKMGIRPEVALKAMTAQEVKREAPAEPLTMSHVDRGSPDLTEETVKVHGGLTPDKTFDISTDDGIVKALQMISLVDMMIVSTDSWNVSQRVRAGSEQNEKLREKLIAWGKVRAASKQNEKLWEKLTALAKQRKLKIKYSGIDGDYAIDYAKESVDHRALQVISEQSKAESIGFFHRNHPAVKHIWAKNTGAVSSDFAYIKSSVNDLIKALGKEAMTVVSDKGHGFEVMDKEGRYISFEVSTVAAGHKISTRKWTKDTELRWEIFTNGRMDESEQKKFLDKVGLYDYHFE